MSWLIPVALCAAAAALLFAPSAELAGASATFDVQRLTRWAPLAAGFVIAMWPGGSLVLAAIAVATAWGVLKLGKRGRGRAEAGRARLSLVEAADALASELRAGLPPASALDHVAGTWPEFVPIATAARLDADVAEAFRRAGSRPGAEALVEVGAAWQVSQQSGSGLAASLDRVVRRARDDLEVHRVVDGELASARATAVMLALMPVGLLTMSGSGPWIFLLTTPFGLGCLALGVAFALAGMWWIEAIVARISAGAA